MNAVTTGTGLPLSRYLLVLLLLSAVALLLYSGSFSHAWTYDDLPVIVNNPDVTSLQNFLADSYPGRPLREATFLLDYTLFGFEPAGWHVQNILWHGLGAGLVGLLALALGLSHGAALLAALLFLVHPLQVEVVAAISHRKDSLALCFELAAVLAYMRFVTAGRRPGWLVLCLVTFALALQAKETAVMLPLVLVGYEWLFVAAPQRFICRKWVLVPATIGLGLAAGYYWHTRLGGFDRYRDVARLNLTKLNYFEPFDFLTYILMTLKSWVFSFSKVLLPTALALEYTFPPPASVFDPWVLVAVAGLLATGWGLVRHRRRAPVVSFCLFWVVCFWLPVANLIWPAAYFAADRYLYAPLAGIAILAAWGVEQLAGTPGRRLAVTGCCAVVLLACAWLTFQQDKVWASSLRLWENAVKVNPTAPIALHGLALEYQERGDYAQAIAYYQQALRNPYNSQSHLNLGNLFLQQGDHTQAIRHYVKFVEMNDADYPRQVAETRQFLRVRYGIVR